MSDYIKREDALNAIHGLTMYRGTIPFDSVIFNINKIPPADVVEVVRCKDCKHRDIDRCGRFKCNVWVCDEDYCSYGERADT